MANWKFWYQRSSQTTRQIKKWQLYSLIWLKLNYLLRLKYVFLYVFATALSCSTSNTTTTKQYKRLKGQIQKHLYHKQVKLLNSTLYLWGLSNKKWSIISELKFKCIFFFLFMIQLHVHQKFSNIPKKDCYIFHNFTRVKNLVSCHDCSDPNIAINLLFPFQVQRLNIPLPTVLFHLAHLWLLQKALNF